MIFLRIHEVNRESTADVLLIFLLITFRKISSPDRQDYRGDWYLRCVECLFVVSFLSFFLSFIQCITFFGYRRCSSFWCWSSSLLQNKMVIKQFAKIPLLICKPLHDLLYLLFFFYLIFHLLSAELLFLINFTCIV